ncbi:hypothetical protein [Egbenema bharatensis]|uniref:hypothetical protein n=1 Tax=Egbenema bharatensis TaxID=3463334 RepID=UPI003A88BB05
MNNSIVVFSVLLLLVLFLRPLLSLFPKTALGAIVEQWMRSRQRQLMFRNRVTKW